MRCTRYCGFNLVLSPTLFTACLKELRRSRFLMSRISGKSIKVSLAIKFWLSDRQVRLLSYSFEIRIPRQTSAFLWFSFYKKKLSKTTTTFTFSVEESMTNKRKRVSRFSSTKRMSHPVKKRPIATLTRCIVILVDNTHQLQLLKDHLLEFQQVQHNLVYWSQKN